MSADRRIQLVGGLAIRRREVDEGAIALFADLHIPADPEIRYGEFSPVENLRQAVAGARGSAACVVNGDISWAAGLEDDYRLAAELLQPLTAVCPTAVMPGNHDRRGPLGAICGGWGSDVLLAAKLVEIFEFETARLICIDALFRTDIVGGLVGKEQRDWLAGELEGGPSKPTVVAVHHPLRDDDDSLLDADRLLRLVERFPQVKAIFTAHDHVLRRETFADGIQVLGQPAVGFPFDPAGSAAWLEARFHAGGVDLNPRVVEGPELDGFTLRWMR